MNTRNATIVVVTCLAVVLLFSPYAWAQQQAPVVKIEAYFSITSSGFFPILACEDGLYLSGAGGNLGASKAIADALTLEKGVDYQSAGLRELMWQGIVMPYVQVHLALLNENLQPLLDLTLYDVSITEIRTAAKDGDKAVEAIKIKYPRACWQSYLPKNLSVKKCWNFEANKYFTPPPQP